MLCVNTVCYQHNCSLGPNIDLKSVTVYLVFFFGKLFQIKLFCEDFL
jgi:hypothetical protein